MKRRVGALLMALVLVMTGFAAYAEEDQLEEAAVEDSVEDALVPEEEPVEGETAAFEEEPAAAAEEPAEVAEPEAAPETTQSAEAESELQTTVPEETQSESAIEPETTALAEETEESEEDIETYTALSGNLSVTVEAPKGALPENVLLNMQSVDADSEEYEEVQSYVKESEEEISNLEIADIYFTLDGEKVDPSEAVTVKLGLTEFTNADKASLKAWDYTDRTQGTFNAETQEVEFITTNLQTFAATWEDDQDEDSLDLYGIMTLGATGESETEEPNPQLTVEIEVTSEPEYGTAYREDEYINYEITVKNTGNVALSYVQLKDELTSETVWTLGPLQPGDESVRYTSYCVTEEDAENKSVTNKAIATGIYNGREYSSDAVEVEVPAEIGPRMSVDYVERSKPKNGEAYQEGETITYTVIVTNTGDYELLNIEVIDTLTQKTLRIPLLGVGESREFDLEYEVQDYDALDSGLLLSGEAEAEYISESGETESVDSIDITSENEEVEVEPRPQKFVDTDGDKDFNDENKKVKVGQELVYKITYKNTDTEEKTVTITDTLEEGLDFVEASDKGKRDGRTVTWKIKNVEPGKEGSVTLTAKVNEEARALWCVWNSATVQLGNDEKDAKTTFEVNNLLDDDDPVQPTKSVSVGNNKVSVGQELTYTINFYNHHSEWETVTITDKLIDGLTYVGNSASDGGKYDSGTITWEVEAEPFSWGKVSFNAKVNEKAVTTTTVDDEYFDDEEEEKTDENGDTIDEDTLTISDSYETITSGSVENYATVKIGDDDETATDAVTNEIYSTSGGSGYGSGSDGEGSGENKAVNTADDTPVAPMAVLFGTALIVLGADIIYRRRRTQR